jgi:hypothetical protein
MPTDHIVQLLIVERDRLDAAISALGGSTAKRRGRPPKDPMANAPDWVLPKKTEKKKSKRVFSAKWRANQARRMKMYWRNKRKGTKAAAATA